MRMLSIRARIIKKLLRIAGSGRSETPDNIQKQRKRFEQSLRILFPSTPLRTERKMISNVPVDIIRTKRTNTDRAIIYLHGGGFVYGSTLSYRQHLKRLSDFSNAKVFAIDYSLSPEAIYPQALDEIQLVWDELVKQKTIDPKHTSLIGDSAGANLACASLLRFRNRKISLPACLVMISPPLDGTFSGDSYGYNAPADPLMNHTKINLFINSYIGSESKRSPLISPIFAELTGFPPILIHVGSEELLFSDSLRFMKNAKRDGAEVTISIGEGMWHIWHLFASYVPEAKIATKNIASFVSKHT